MTQRSRKPTGRPSHPCILIEGDEKAGKSWMAAEFTKDPRLGACYWVDLAEGDGDLYGSIGNYEIQPHDGTYNDIYAAIAEVHAEAARAHAAGDKPTVLIVDPIGPLWSLLSDWAYNRAKKSASNKKLLAEDPNAEINIGPGYWNPATERWRRTMTLLLTFPGIVLLLARGKEIAAIGPDGNPVRGQKDYRVEGHKTLCHDVTAWVRVTRGQPPRIIGGRSTKVDFRPESYRAAAVKDFSLGWLIFDALGYDPVTARVREGMELHPGSEAPPSERATVIEAAIDAAPDEEHLKSAFLWIGPALEQEQITGDEARRLADKVKACLAAMQPAAPAEERVNGHDPELVGAAGG